jgi:hypothetical protein
MTLVISKGLTLDNGTRAAAIAGVSPTLDYRFAREKREIETVSLTDKLTYTGGNGTFVGSDGFIQRATTNVPRFDHDPLSRQSLGLLSEVERVNLLLRSEEFQTTWAPTLSSVTVNTERAPSGTLTADTLATNNGTTIINAYVSQDITKAASATTYTYSVYAKQGGLNSITLVAHQASDLGNRGIVGVSLVNGSITTAASAVGTFTAASAVVIPFDAGWYRIALTFTTSTETLLRLRISARDATATTGDGTSGIYLWGAQLEAASSASTYIPTTTATVTRTADSAVIDGTGVITGTYTMVEKPAGCAVVSGSNINLEPGFTAERVMVFPAALDAGQITAIRGAM